MRNDNNNSIFKRDGINIDEYPKKDDWVNEINVDSCTAKEVIVSPSGQVIVNNLHFDFRKTTIINNYYNNQRNESED